MVQHHLTLGDTVSGEQRRSTLHSALGWAMVLLAMLVASVGFTLDHVLPISP